MACANRVLKNNMDKKIIFYFILGFVFIGVVTLIVNSIYKPTTQSNKLQVAASFYPLYYFSQQIAGDKANVINITPAGAEPHDYEPTAQDIAQIENSKMLVLNGGGLEAWGSDIKQNLNAKNTIIVTAGEGLTNQQVMENGQNITDPHIWQSPPLAKQMVDKILAGFIQIDPANSSYYQTNADALKVQLDNFTSC